MEKNNASNIEFCSNGCGFYSNPMYNNMCSKCFKDLQKAEESKQQLLKDLTASATTNNTNNPSTNVKSVIEPTPIPKFKTETPPSKVNSEETKTPKQANPGRCYQCKAKVSLIKQTTNKCKCKFIFCDDHRIPEKHSCEVDIARHDKDVIAKLNPKIHTKPRAGNQFTRID